MNLKVKVGAAEPTIRYVSCNTWLNNSSAGGQNSGGPTTSS